METCHRCKTTSYSNDWFYCNNCGKIFCERCCENGDIEFLVKADYLDESFWIDENCELYTTKDFEDENWWLNHEDLKDLTPAEKLSAINQMKEELEEMQINITYETDLDICNSGDLYFWTIVQNDNVKCQYCTLNPKYRKYTNKKRLKYLLQKYNLTTKELDLEICMYQFSNNVKSASEN